MDTNNIPLKKRKNQKEAKKNVDEVNDRVFTKPGELPVKLYEDRTSVLTELFETKHIASVYHLFMAGFVGFCISSLVHDYLYNGKVRLGYNLVSKSFRNMHLMAMTWFCIFFLSLVPYYGIKYWAQARSTLKLKSLQVYLWDRLCLICYILYLFGMLYCGTVMLLKFDMGFAAGLSAITETVRLIMKTYSFGRVCISRVLNQPEKYSKQHPKFSQYLYYSFAPTLLYRDSYPRSPESIRWRLVASYFFEFVVAIIFMSIMFDTIFVSQFENYGLNHLPVRDIVMNIINNVPYGLLTMFTIHYIILHLWLNPFAEMLRFSDKLFYKDWWTSSDYERYYRTWNTVVHDWLYTYIYKDFFEIVLPRRKLIGKAAVFFVSAIFHDYVVSLAIGYYLPVFFMYFFVFGQLVAHVRFPNNLIGNVFFFYTLGLGASMMIAVYSLEYYARANCIKENLTTLDYFIPKLFECYI